LTTLSLAQRRWPLLAVLLAALLGDVGCRDSLGAAVPASSVTASKHTSTASTPTSQGFVVRTVTDGGISYPYQVFLPAAFDSTRAWPVIVALHGSEERGTDGVAPTRTGLGLLVRARAATFPAIVIFPQFPRGIEGIEIGQRNVMRELDAVLAEFHGDSDRVYLTGLSFGGAIALNIAFQYPTRFAALLPISSGICPRCMAEMTGLSPDAQYPAVARRLRTIPTWVFHGEKDSNVPVIAARQFVRALEVAGASVRYTEYPGEGHNVWDRAYADPLVFAWLLAQRRKP
jgi:predicted peptidase